LIHRPKHVGTEDYIVFNRKPDAEQLVYHVDVSAVAGLRLVANVLEFLDADGAPRLRMSPPFVVDNKGVEHEAITHIAVEKAKTTK